MSDSDSRSQSARDLTDSTPLLDIIGTAFIFCCQAQHHVASAAIPHRRRALAQLPRDFPHTIAGIFDSSDPLRCAASIALRRSVLVARSWGVMTAPDKLRVPK